MQYYLKHHKVSPLEYKVKNSTKNSLDRYYNIVSRMSMILDPCTNQFSRLICNLFVRKNVTDKTGELFAFQRLDQSSACHIQLRGPLRAVVR